MATINPGQFTAALGQSYGFDSVVPPFYITGATLTANAASFPVLPIPAYPTLEIRLNCPGLSGSDIPTLRFNGDGGNNYWDRNVSIAQGATLNTNAETATTAQIRLGIATTKQIVASLNIINFLGQGKVVSGRVVIGSGAVATPGIVIQQAGEWVNTTAQITSVTALILGANSFLAGSSIMIFGGY